jgi:eukaryotic-like serine/threonine-protein kinase
VTLYECLYGERPFDPPRRGRGDLPWVLRPTPTGAKVPGWLRAVALRAIALDPARRYPTMQLLLDALERDLGARRRWIAAGAGAAVAAGAFLLLAMRSDQRAVCRPSGDELAGAWDPARRDAAKAAFLASGHPVAADRFARFAAAVDDYTGRWGAMRVEACRATRVTGAQSEALLDLRVACLDRLRRKLAAVTGLYTGALDAAAVDTAPDAAFRLGDLDRCADAEALLGMARPPRDPARRAQADQARRDLDEAEALQQAGRPGEALALGRKVVAAAAGLDPGLRAEASYAVGRAAGELAETAQATAALYDATRLAAEAHDDELAARSWIDLVYEVGYRGAKLEDGEQLLKVADAAVARAGADDILRLALLHRRAILAYMQGKLPAARADFEQAVALAEAAHGSRHPRVADMLVSLGNVLKAQAELARARASHERATAIYEAALGPDHPRVTFGLENLGTVLESSGDFAGAAALYARVVGICERSYGPSHPDVAHALANLGSAYVALGRSAEARPLLERALGINQAALGPRHPDTAQVLFQLGRATAATDRAAAIDFHRRALAIREAALGPDAADVTASRTALADLGVK